MNNMAFNQYNHLIYYMRTALCLLLCVLPLVGRKNQENYLKEEMINISMSETINSDDNRVIKRVLDNGLTILVCENHTIPKVSLQLWYNVGSKDELMDEKGIAHLIEHMIFKGTDILSESDINTLVHKLSGSCNAFTSFDYTGYLFNFPTHHWREALPLFADCMTNCSFDDDMLNSEMKAVIQELKMGRDDYNRTLAKELIGMVFADHPYHYPIIGYKQDLWNMKGKHLLDFYQKHYCPNNATLVVVGDVGSEEVFDLAEQYFGPIQKNASYEKKRYFFNKDIVSKSVTFYRDVVQPALMYMFVVPGATEKHDASLEIFEWILGKGKSSRLYKKLVDQAQLATDVSVFFWNLFDHGVFFIVVDPKDREICSQIEEIVTQELQNLAEYGVQDDELERGYKKTQMSYYSLLEDIESQAEAIGHNYLATGDENYVFNALNDSLETFKSDINNLVKTYFRPAVMHKGLVLPLPQSENDQWAELQQQSDEEDSLILAARERKTLIEDPSYSRLICPQKPAEFVFPKPETHSLNNGIKLFTYNSNITPKINMVIDFAARPYFDPIDQQGLYSFVANMMTEGTVHYTGQELAEAIESRGMSLDVYPGGIALRMLHDDFEFGLDIVNELLTNALFPEQEIEKIRQQMLVDIKQYWDEPRSFIGQLVRNEMYKNHPYSKQIMGTKESVESITREDLINFYKKYICCTGARIAIVGDLHGYKVQSLVEKKLASWQASVVPTIEFPQLNSLANQEINYPINRDQVVLCLAQLSIDRYHPDYDKYLLFDQIFGGGVLGSMSSRLFDLREHTGLFYTIYGSLIVGVDEQPGMFQIKTIVSLDRLAEAEKAIKNVIDTVIETLTEEDLAEAKRAVASVLVDNFASNSSMAGAFLFIDRFKFPSDYFDKRAEQLERVTLDDMKQAIKKMLSSKDLLTVRVGRV